MKKIVKKFMAILMLVCMISCMTGCDLLDNLSMATNTTVTMKLNTDDTIQAKLVSEAQKTLKFDEDGDNLKIWNKEKELILDCDLVDLQTLEKFIKDSDIWMDSYGDFTTDSMVVSKCKYQPKDQKATYYMIGWVIGSNTGFIARGTNYQATLDEVSTELNLTVKKTLQTDDTYFPDCIKIK